MKKDSKNKLILTIFLLTLVATGIAINVKQHLDIDQSKLPDKVEASGGFQRWITNLKNKDIEITADEFRLLEENEIYNTKWMTVYSLDEEGMKEKFEQNLNDHKNIKKVIFSPSEREYIDYRNEKRDSFEPNQVHFYGLKEDKVIDARILDCSVDANCYFDRAYFLDNDVFVITEFSRNIDKKDQSPPICTTEDTCIYTVKLHVIDLINNSRLVYESKPMELVLSETIPEL